MLNAKQDILLVIFPRSFIHLILIGGQHYEHFVEDGLEGLLWNT